MPKPSTLRNTPAFAFSSASRTSSPVAGDADVEIAVGAEEHAVDAALDEIVAGPSGRPAECPARRWSSRRPAGCRSPRRIVGLLGAAGRRQHQPRRAGIDHDRHAVVLAELPHEHRSARCTSGSRFGWSIEPETSIRNTRLLTGRSPIELACPGCRTAPADAAAARGTRPFRCGPRTDARRSARRSRSRNS